MNESSLQKNARSNIAKNVGCEKFYLLTAPAPKASSIEAYPAAKDAASK